MAIGSAVFAETGGDIDAVFESRRQSFDREPSLRRADHVAAKVIRERAVWMIDLHAKLDLPAGDRLAFMIQNPPVCGCGRPDWHEHIILARSHLPNALQL